MNKERRVIITKRKTYRLDQDAHGVPVDDYFPKAKLPESIKGCFAGGGGIIP